MIRVLAIFVLINSCSEAQEIKNVHNKSEDQTTQTEMTKSNRISDFSDAVVYGDLDRVKELASEDKSIINSQDEYGFSALHNVMCEEQPETTEYIIENGADVNLANEDGVTPIHLACSVRNAEILLDNGADINLKSRNGNTPLHTLVSDGEERFEVIKFLISRGAEKSLTNNSGKTPLDIARMRDDERIIQLLIKD